MEGQPARLDRYLLVVGTLVLFAAQLWITSHVDAPTVVFDENGYLGNARWLAGGAPWDMPFAPTYAAGYSLLITPVMAVVHAPADRWQAILVINALLLCSVFPLVVAVLERVLDVPRRRAMAAAAVAAMAPAMVATGVSAVAENLVLPMVPLSILAGWAMLDPQRRVRARIWLGPAVAVLYAAHPRFTLAVPIVLVALVAAAVRRPSDRVVAAVNAALLVVGVVAVRLLDAAVWGARWERVERLEGGASSWLELVMSGHGLVELGLTAVGQAWYLVIGSIGLIAVGVAVLARGITAGAPAGEPGDAARRRRAVVGTTLVVAGAVFATSVLFFAQNRFRADHFVYGRHNDSFAPLWIAVAMAYLLDRVGSRRPIALLSAVAALAAVLSGVLVAFRDPADEQNVFSPFAVPAVIRFVAHDPRHLFVRASVFGLLGIGAVALLVWTSRRESFPARLRSGSLGVLGVGLAGWYAFAGFGVVRGTQDFATLIYEDWTPIATIERLDVPELCIDAAAVRGRATLSYPWHLPDVAIRSYDSAAGQDPPCTFTIARTDDADRAAAGDRIAVLDQGGLYGLWDAPRGLAMWVAPGARQDELADRGALLPEGFPAPLATEAQRATIRLREPGDRTLTVPSGEHLHVPVTLTHRGSGAPWPDFASYAQAGHVRVAAQITPLDPDGVEGARSGGELPSWMLPGDRTDVDVDLIAVDQLLAPLPPGRYRVQLGVSQDGEDWFASGGPAGAFTLEVTPRR